MAPTSGADAAEVMHDTEFRKRMTPRAEPGRSADATPMEAPQLVETPKKQRLEGTVARLASGAIVYRVPYRRTK